MGDLVNITDYRKRKHVSKNDNSTKILKDMLSTVNNNPMNSYDILSIHRIEDSFILYPNGKDIAIDTSTLRDYIYSVHGIDYSTDPVNFIVSVVVAVSPNSIYYFLPSIVTEIDQEIIAILQTMFGNSLYICDQ